MSPEDELVDAATDLVFERCREELLDAEAGYRKCNEPAEFVLWGKFFPPKALGPRCYDHAAKYVHPAGLGPRTGYALMDLRPVQRALGGESE